MGALLNGVWSRPVLRPLAVADPEADFDVHPVVGDLIVIDDSLELLDVNRLDIPDRLLRFPQRFLRGRLPAIGRLRQQLDYLDNCHLSTSLRDRPEPSTIPGR